MPAETRFSQRSQKVPQSLVSKKIQALIGDFEPRLLLRFADLAANARTFCRIMRLVNAEVIFLLHALDELLDQFFERSFALHLLQLLAKFIRKQITSEQRLLHRAAQVI